MRPHVRVIPLVIAFVVSAFAVVSIPVDANERSCRETPDLPSCAEPLWVPWIVRLAQHGY